MSKQIYDPVHGFITITPLMQNIIDTPEFQRLRDLKQLGAVHYVYPSATHTRFEHSLGVSHLAGIMAENLIQYASLHNTPEEIYTEVMNKEKTIELCRIAGLIHDIGHGPFSHLYDNQVRNHSEPEHEERGCEIFKRMVPKYKLNLTKKEVNLIVEMIVPPEEKKKIWLYQIIANKECQIDVDKIDYIQRDCYHTGLKFGGEWTRLLTQCKIINTELNANAQITWPKKLEYEIFQLFATRYRLHKQVYNHHTVKAYEYYIVHILKAAKRKNAQFLDMTDSLVTCRLHDEWRELQNKIARREIPKLVGETTISIEEHEAKVMDYTFPRTILNLIIDHIKIGFASGHINPLDKVLLFNKAGEITGIDKSDSICLPTKHREVIVRWYNTVPSQHEEAIKEFKLSLK